MCVLRIGLDCNNPQLWKRKQFITTYEDDCIIFCKKVNFEINK